MPDLSPGAARYTVVSHGTRSFYEQGLGLAIGLRQLGIACRLTGLPPRLTLGRRWLEQSRCIGIGSWRSLSRVLDEPRSMRADVVPWLVSDDTVPKDAARRLDLLDWFYVPSGWCRDTFADAGVSPEKMRILPEGIDTDFWSPGHAGRLDAPRQWLVPLWRSRRVNGGGLRNVRRLAAMLADRSLARVLTIGEDVTSKGFLEVLEGLEGAGRSDWVAVAKIRDTASSRHNVLRERALAARLGLAARVVYIVGNYRRTFIRDLFRWCSTYAAPSRHEGFGLPHVQALSCGKPVITCHGTAAAETSIHGVTGFVVPSDPCEWPNADGHAVRGVRGDPAAIRDALRTIFGDASLRCRMAAAGRLHAVDRFSCRAVAARVIDDATTKDIDANPG